MIYTYKFADGTTNESEVSDKMAAELKELDRIEYNNNQAETRRHASLETLNLDDGLFASDMNIEREIEIKDQNSKLHKAIKKLSLKQRYLIYSVYFQEISINEYAKRHGVTQPAISQRLNTIYKKLKNFNK